MSVIDNYLEDVSSPQKRELERVRRIIISTVPEAEEVITYGMPGYKYKGKYLIAFAPFKNHMSIFPGTGAIVALKDKLTKFKLSKGTIQFTKENPIPEPTLKAIILNRIREIENS
jgi:uncharacterized protein YdhG (YjbR/CyaY superfamily)